MSLQATFNSTDYSTKLVELSSGRILRLAVIAKHFTFYPTGTPIDFTSSTANYVDKYNVQYKNGNYQVQFQCQFACDIGTYGMSPDDPLYDKIIKKPGIGQDKFTPEEKADLLSAYKDGASGDDFWGICPDISRFGFTPFTPANNIPAYDGVVPFFPIGEFAPITSISYFFEKGGVQSGLKKLSTLSNVSTSTGDVTVTVFNEVDAPTTGVYAIPIIRQPFMQINDFNKGTFTAWYCDIVEV